MTTPPEARRESAKYLREGCVRYGLWHDGDGGKQIACKFGSLGRPARFATSLKRKLQHLMEKGDALR